MPFFATYADEHFDKLFILSKSVTKKIFFAKPK